MNVTPGLFSAEQLRLSLVPDAARLELSSGGPDRGSSDFREAQIVLGLHPRVEADEPGKIPGKTACAWCGRSDVPGGLTTIDYRPVTRTEHTDPATLAHSVTEHYGEPYRGPLHCVSDGDCQAAHDEREEDWADGQDPGWRSRLARVRTAQAARAIDWKKTLAARQYAAAQAASSKFFHPDPEYAYAGLAAEFRPPDSFYSDLAVALAARRRPADELELAAELPESEQGAAIGGHLYDQPGPAPWAMLPADPWAHTMRNPANRSHLLGHMRRGHPEVTDAAVAMARRTVDSAGQGSGGPAASSR